MLRKPGFFTKPLMEVDQLSGNERKAVLRLLFYNVKVRNVRLRKR